MASTSDPVSGPASAGDPPMPSIAESLGLRPLNERMRQAMVALRGAEDVPPSQFGLSSLRLLSPRLALPLWAGRFVVPRHAVVTNLFNHTQTPPSEGWSVRRTQVRDFRGGSLTYDSHNGTDFAIPRGTPVVAPAPGRVARIDHEFNRGGLKVMIDHGEGLCTCSAHLARALVRVGDVLRRGQPFAVSGYSGLDGLVSFPFGIPHVHFNTWLDGEPVDPFATGDEPSLWLGGAPTPPTGEGDEPFVPAEYDAEAVDESIARCLTASVRERLAALPTLELRATHLIWERNYYPTRFPLKNSLYSRSHPRRPRLSLPFPARDFDGVVFADEL
ncbi:MAG: M23 family metallopeptidase [Myxococcota bacterium]